MRLFSRRVHELSGAYALDALDDAERQRFERHLRRCPACDEDVRRMTSTATALAMAVSAEPPPGLHMADVANLLALLEAMVDNGTTLLVIEHNLDVVARADWIIDMGPGAGAEGGKVVFEGAPRELLKASKSLTGKHLAARFG